MVVKNAKSGDSSIPSETLVRRRFESIMDAPLRGIPVCATPEKYSGLPITEVRFFFGARIYNTFGAKIFNTFGAKSVILLAPKYYIFNTVHLYIK